jgi:hypothetical protein
MAKQKGILVEREEGKTISQYLNEAFAGTLHFKRPVVNVRGEEYGNKFDIIERSSGEVVGTSGAYLPLPVGRVVDGSVILKDAPSFGGAQMLDQVRDLAAALDEKGFRVGGIGQGSAGLWMDNNRSRATLFVEHKEITGEVKKGDLVGFGLRWDWGIDGNTVCSGSAFLKRIICSNGMAGAGESLFDFRAKHSVGFAGSLVGIREGIQNAMDNFASVFPVYKKLAGSILSDEAARKVVEEAVGKRAAQQVLDTWGNGRGQDGDKDAYNLLNSVTEFLSDNFNARTGTDSGAAIAQAERDLLALV